LGGAAGSAFGLFLTSEDARGPGVRTTLPFFGGGADEALNEGVQPFEEAEGLAIGAPPFGTGFGGGQGIFILAHSTSAILSGLGINGGQGIFSLAHSIFTSLSARERSAQRVDIVFLQKSDRVKPSTFALQLKTLSQNGVWVINIDIPSLNNFTIRIDYAISLRKTNTLVIHVATQMAMIKIM
jgi:hypothetical protein